MSLFNVELPDNTAICPQCGVKYDIYGFHSCGSIDEAVKKALAIRDTEWKLEYGKLVEQARKELAARDKWWIDRLFQKCPHATQFRIAGECILCLREIKKEIGL